MRIVATILAMSLLIGCDSRATGPVAIAPDDACAFCRMLISDRRFAAEMLDSDGTVYKFDDIACMLRFAQAHGKNAPSAHFYVSNFAHSGEWLDVSRAYFVKLQFSSSSPMASGLIAFGSTSDAAQATGRGSARLLRFGDLQAYILNDIGTTANATQPQERIGTGHGR